MTGSDRDLGWMWASLTYVGLSLSTLTWVPILSRGGTLIELSNFTQLIFILLLPLALLLSRRSMPAHLLFLLLIAWSLIILLALALHGDRSQAGMVRQQFVQALFGWSLALCIANSAVSIGRAALVALAILLAALEFSAIRAGSSLTLGALQFVQTLDRNEFIFGIIRPALNVFAQQEGDLEYEASQINNVANSMVLLACIAFFREPGGMATRRFGVGKLLAALALVLAFVIFSSSAVLVIAVFVLASALQAAMRLPPQGRALAFLLLAGLAVALFRPLSGFLAVNVGEDELSREARMEQLRVAIETIDSSVILGVGYLEAGGHVVHNWILFSWATAGLVGLLLVLTVYLVVFGVAFLLIRAVPWALPTALALVTVFVVRTSVGGAGGIPSGPTILAAAVLTGLLVRHGRGAKARNHAFRVAQGAPG